MAYTFYLPDIGEGLTEAVIVTWHTELGNTVGLDHPLVEIETDKAVVEIPSPREGYLLYRGAQENDTIQVGALLAVIGEKDEAWPQNTDAPASERAQRLANEPIVGSLEETSSPAGNQVQAIPMVRKLAAELSVDLDSVSGTGTRGKVTEDDVRSAAHGRPMTRRPMSTIRRAIAHNLSRSWREIPHVTTFGEAAAEPLFDLRSKIGEPPLEALMTALVCPLMHDFPAFNSKIDNDTIVEREYYDIGFAVDTPGGLTVAVIRDADSLSIDSLVAEVARLTTAARNKTLQPEELRGQGFTISNIGAVGGGYGTPIIPQGTAAILSIGRAVIRPVIRDNQIVAGREFPLSLSYDHRLIDGAEGRRFMAAIIASMENPSLK